MMASAQVVEISVNTNNSPSQDYTTNQDDHSNHNKVCIVLYIMAKALGELVDDDVTSYKIGENVALCLLYIRAVCGNFCWHCRQYSAFKNYQVKNMSSAYKMVTIDAQS